MQPECLPTWPVMGLKHGLFVSRRGRHHHDEDEDHHDEDEDHCDEDDHDEDEDDHDEDEDDHDENANAVNIEMVVITDRT